jgi:uncharacterized membrane protein
MENALLYTFSTIAQTLGGAIALLSAFVLYRFQSLDASMAKEAQELRPEFQMAGGNAAEYDRIESAGDYKELLESIKNRGERSFSVPAFKRLKHGVISKRKVTDAFMAAVSFTGTTMMFSIIVLTITHILVARSIVSYFILAAGVILFGVCIWIYWLVISAALGIRKFRDQK